MDLDHQRRLLEAVRTGELSVAAALAALGGSHPDAASPAPLAQEVRAGEHVLAQIDHDRERRCGAPEVILGSAKQPDDLPALAGAIVEQSGRVLVTRVDRPRLAALTKAFPEGEVHERARAFTVDRRGEQPPGRPGTLILSAGTGDLPVAEEARVAAAWLGEAPILRTDVGVAGIHRLLAQQAALDAARVVVVIAGMEGALPSVVAGLVSVPVIAVPTSVGYGASLEGVTPLLAMLSGCAPGVGVVNIDNGFGAGVLAARINGA